MPTNLYTLGGGRAIISLSDGTIIECNVSSITLEQHSFGILGGEINQSIDLRLRCSHADISRQTIMCDEPNSTGCHHALQHQNRDTHELVYLCSLPPKRQCPKKMTVQQRLQETVSKPLQMESEKDQQIAEMKAVLWTVLKHLGGKLEYDSQTLQEIIASRPECKITLLKEAGTRTISMEASGDVSDEYTIQVFSKNKKQQKVQRRLRLTPTEEITDEVAVCE
jgi:hypothetical protein